MRRKIRVLKFIVVVAVFAAIWYLVAMFLDVRSKEERIFNNFINSLEPIPENKRPLIDVPTSFAIKDLANKFRFDAKLFSKPINFTVLKVKTAYIKRSCCFASMIKFNAENNDTIKDFVKRIEEHYSLVVRPIYKRLPYESDMYGVNGYLLMSWEFRDIIGGG